VTTDNDHDQQRAHMWYEWREKWRNKEEMYKGIMKMQTEKVAIENDKLTYVSHIVFIEYGIVRLQLGYTDEN
jgi:hypothetical protein